MANIEEHYKHVFVHHYRTEDELVEVNPKYVYMMIPTEYVCVYHKLLVYLADFGKALLSDCSAACRGNSKTIVDCWNMFQSALACKALGRDKEAQLYIDYIKAQLKLVYKGTGKEVYDDAFIAPLDRFGHLHGIVSCGDVVKFMVDPETGELLEKTTEDADHVFVRDDEVIPPVEKFTLSGIVNPAEAATINYLGKYTKGTKVAVSFTIADGYELEKVTTDINKADIEGDWLTDAQVIVTMNKNSEIIANFKKKVEPKPEPTYKTITIGALDIDDVYGGTNGGYFKWKLDSDTDWRKHSNSIKFDNVTVNEMKFFNIIAALEETKTNYDFVGWYNLNKDGSIGSIITTQELVEIIPEPIIDNNTINRICCGFKKKVIPEPEPEPIKTLSIYRAKADDIHNPFGDVYIKLDGSYKDTNKFNIEYKESTITVEAKVLDEEGYEFDGWYSYGNGNPIPDNMDYTDLFLEFIDKEFKFTTSPYSKNGVVLIAILKKKPIRYKDYYIHCTSDNGPLTNLYGHFLFNHSDIGDYGGPILEVRTGGTEEPSPGQDNSKVYVKAVKDAPSNIFVGWYKKHHINNTTELSECTLISTDMETVIDIDQITDESNTRIDIIGVFKRNFIKYKVAVWSTASKIIGSAGRTTINAVPNKDSEPGGQLNHSIAEGILETSMLRCQIYNLDDDYETISWRSLETEDTSLVPDPFIDMRQHSVWHIEETVSVESCIMYLVCNVKKSVPFDLAAVYNDLDPVVHHTFERSGQCKLTYIATKEGESKDIIATGINRFSSYSKDIEMKFIEKADSNYQFVGWYYKDVPDKDNEFDSRIPYDEVISTYKFLDYNPKTAAGIIREDLNKGIKRVFKAVFRRK